jgi:hypothetical protein
MMKEQTCYNLLPSVLSRIKQQVEFAVCIECGISSDVFQVERPSPCQCSKTATDATPSFEVALYAVVLAMTSFMGGGGFSPAFALIDWVMVFNLLICGDWLLAEITIHIAIPS